MANFLPSLSGIILQVFMWGAFIGMVFGYGIMGQGIAEAAGLPIAIIAVFSVVLMPIFVFFGIWYNPKIQHGFAIFIVSLLCLVGATMFL